MKGDLSMFKVNWPSSYAVCEYNRTRVLSETPAFSCDFQPGLYALTGPMERGGWGFAYAISSRRHKETITDGTPSFALDDVSYSLEEIRRQAHPLGVPRGLIARRRFAQSQIRDKSLISVFDLTQARINRPIWQAGNEVWRITTAIGIDQGKRIFCFPWLSAKHVEILRPSLEFISEEMKKRGTYCFLPMAASPNADLPVDGIIDFSNDAVCRLEVPAPGHP